MNLVALLLAFSFSGPLTPEKGRVALFEAKLLCERDQGSLWGESLCGPMLIVDPGSRTAIGNTPDTKGQLTPQGRVFVGTLPPSEPLANTAVDWSGITWAEVLWPLPDDKRDRDVLLAHESFHRIQKKLGVPLAGSGNAHLDKTDGRVWLQLEWKALEAALLATTEPERRRAITDALIFRAQRRALFSGSANEENALELGEGLAQYTGVRVAFGRDQDARHYAAHGLHKAPAQESFVRSFAYASGPAYGLLLDLVDPHWRREIGGIHDLGTRLQTDLALNLPKDLAQQAQKVAARYDYPHLLAAENARAQKRAKLEASDRAALVTGPVLHIPNDHLQLQFDPRTVRTLEGAGTVYPGLHASGAFGVLTVTGPALVDPEWKAVTIAAPSDASKRPLTGPGWKLELAKGWTVVPDARAGDFKVAPEAAQ